MIVSFAVAFRAVLFVTRILPIAVPVATFEPAVGESVVLVTDPGFPASRIAVALAAAGTATTTGVAATTMLNGTTCVTAAPAWRDETIALKLYVQALIVLVVVSPSEYFTFVENVPFASAGA